MGDATFNEGGLELILIEIVAGVGRSHAVSAVGAAAVVVVVVVMAAAAAASLVGLVEQLFVTVHEWVAAPPPTLLTHILTLKIYDCTGLARMVLGMGESIVEQWVWQQVVWHIGLLIGQ